MKSILFILFFLVASCDTPTKEEYEKRDQDNFKSYINSRYQYSKIQCAWSDEYNICFCGGLNGNATVLTWVPDKVCGK